MKKLYIDNPWLPKLKSVDVFLGDVTQNYVTTVWLSIKMKLLEATKFEDINHRPRPRKWRQDSATIVASFRSQATNMGGGYSFPVTICSLAIHQVKTSRIWRWVADKKWYENGKKPLKTIIS